MRTIAWILLSASMAAACTPAGEGGSTPPGTGGKPTPPAGTGGSATAGTGGTAPSGTGGSTSPATGGSTPSATGGSTPAGTGGSPAGTGGATVPDAGGDAPADLPAAMPGLTRIFDGTSWEGWEYNPRCWKLVDGAMRGECPSGQSQAFTKESYSNFRLILESRMVASNDHLGICIWGGRPAAGNWGFAGCLLPQPPGGAFWDYATNTDHPTGGDKSMQNQWHTTELLANRTTGKVLMAVNGKLVHTFMDKQLARRKHGPIGMQIHKATPTIVEYRNIQIEVDPKEDRLITLKP